MLVWLWRSWNPCTLLVKTYSAAAVESNMEILQKLKNDHMIQQFHFRQQGLTQVSAHTCSQQHYLQLPRGRSNPSVHRSVNKWINKIQYIHTIKYFSAAKRNEILIHATTWMKLQGIMLSERSQTQNDKRCMISYMRLLLSNGYRVSVWDDEVLDMDCGHPHMNVL